MIANGFTSSCNEQIHFLLRLFIASFIGDVLLFAFIYLDNHRSITTMQKLIAGEPSPIRKLIVHCLKKRRLLNLRLILLLTVKFFDEVNAVELTLFVDHVVTLELRGLSGLFHRLEQGNS